MDDVGVDRGDVVFDLFVFLGVVLFVFFVGGEEELEVFYVVVKGGEVEGDVLVYLGVVEFWGGDIGDSGGSRGWVGGVIFLGWVIFWFLYEDGVCEVVEGVDVFGDVFVGFFFYGEELGFVEFIFFFFV